MHREFEARPLFLMLVGALLGLNFPSQPLLIAALIIGTVFFRQKFVVFTVLGVLAGAVLVLEKAEPRPLANGFFRGELTIRSFPEYSRGQTICTATSGETTCIAKFKGQIALAPGDQVLGVGVCRAGKSANLTVRDWQLIRPGWLHFISEMRVGAIDRLKVLYGDEDASWVTALTFNYAADLAREDKDALRNSGTFHLVSASGLHVWVVALLVQFLLVQITLPRHWQILLTGFMLLVYCGLTGFHSPTVRSALMWLTYSSAYLFRRSPDALSSLSLSALIWLAFVPEDIQNASFQLSYVVTGMLILWFERQRQQDGIEIRNGLEISLAASFAAEPLAAWWFGRLVLVGPIANALVGLASSVILVLGMVSLVPVVGTVAVWICKPLVWGVREVTTFVGQFPAIQFPPRVFHGGWLVLYFAVLLGVLLLRKPRLGDVLAKP
jgi:ComEC/Rec2-related protein